MIAVASSCDTETGMRTQAPSLAAISITGTDTAVNAGTPGNTTTGENPKAEVCNSFRHR
jgi:hypothetical protein